MSVAALPTDSSIKTPAPQAGKRHTKADGEPASDFKALVKGEANEAAHANKGSEASAAKGENAEAANQRDDGTVWPRWSSTLFDRHASNTDADAENAEEAVDGDQTDGETLPGEVEKTVPVMPNATAEAAREKAAAKQDAQGQNGGTNGSASNANMGADGAVVSAAAKDAEAPGDVRAVTPGATPGEAAAVLGHKPEVQQRAATQAARGGGAEQTQAGPQSSAASAVVPTDGDAGDGTADGDSGKGDGQNRDQMASRSGQAQTGNRVSGVTVVSQQVSPALPVQPAGMTPTGASFASSLAEGLSGAARSDAAAQVSAAQAASKPGPVTTLSIQLQPVELGMVTARISGTEAQLSIEITVNNAEARHRLSSDSDAIVTALRGLGIDVDRISIQQSQANSGTTPNGAGRGNEFAQQGGDRGNQQGQASQQGFERGNGRDVPRGQGNAQSENAGDGVYI